MGFRGLSVVLGAAVALCGCGVSGPSQNTEMFSGTVAVGGSGPLHQFAASKSGEYSIQLTSLTPTTGNPNGVVFGQPLSSTQCGIISSNRAIVGVVALSGGIEKGSYCVQLFDTGLFTQA